MRRSTEQFIVNQPSCQVMHLDVKESIDVDHLERTSTLAEMGIADGHYRMFEHGRFPGRLQ